MNTLSTKQTPKEIVVKILVIIGFAATIFLFLWLGVKLIGVISPSLANLASVAKTMQEYKPVDMLEIVADKDIVNSKESFQINWTDMQQTGEFKFSFECAEGITVLVRGASGKLLPMTCNDTLTLPGTVQGLYLSIESLKTRFADVNLSVAFISSQKEITHVAEARVTVVNVTVGQEPEVMGVDTEETTDPEEAPEPTPTPSTPAPSPHTAQPIYTTIYPLSNPNGYVDLAVTALGIGEVRGGTFYFGSALDGNDRNAIRFDVQNTGTKTSDVWDFQIDFPDGTTYHSSAQSPLRPLEHAVLTLEFELDNFDDTYANITIEIDTINDTHPSNDDVTWRSKVY